MLILCGVVGPRPAAAGDPGPSANPAGEVQPGVTGEKDEVEKDENDLRQRLTEREDKRRLALPRTLEIFGETLILGGQYEIVFDWIDPVVVGDDTKHENRLLLQQEVEFEAFYTRGLEFSLFSQVKFSMDEDIARGTPDSASDYYVERGEMWLFSEDIFGTGLSFEIGRLDFEDDRRSWWDVELDAIRLTYGLKDFEVAFAVAREIGPSRSDRNYIESDHEDVLRFIVEASWDWSPNQGLELFALHQDDGSGVEPPGRFVDDDVQDESDANLTWVGARALGALEWGSGGIFGYWLEGAFVTGQETLVDFETVDGQSMAVGHHRQDVRGWALDAGLSWGLPWDCEPRVTLAYAFGSGDEDPENGTDRSFQQTGLHANEAGFGGVRSMLHYGALLDPELSNLHIATAAVGISLFSASSLDLVFHHYRLVERADALRDARLDGQLTGRSRDFGQGLDLVLAVQEWERFEFDAIGSTFRAGRAFGRDDGKWVFGGVLAFRMIF